MYLVCCLRPPQQGKTPLQSQVAERRRVGREALEQIEKLPKSNQVSCGKLDYLGNLEFCILDCRCLDFDWRLHNRSVDKNNTFRIDGSGEFLHLLADFVGH